MPVHPVTHDLTVYDVCVSGACDCPLASATEVMRTGFRGLSLSVIFF
jgi:hypothetical protein